MKPVTRRSVMAGSAAAMTAIPVLGRAHVDGQGADAKLLGLWAEYVRLQGEEDKALEAFSKAEEAAYQDCPAHDWRYHGINFRGPKQPLAVFVCDRTIQTKTFTLRAKTARKQEAEAHTIADRLRKELAQARAQSEKKHRVEELSRAETRIARRMDDIQREIGETAAQTMKGMAVKFAALYAELDFMQEPASEIVASTYRDIAPLLDVRSLRAD